MGRRGLTPKDRKSRKKQEDPEVPKDRTVPKGRQAVVPAAATSFR